jgi:hypothetical protein
MGFEGLGKGYGGRWVELECWRYKGWVAVCIEHGEMSKRG